MGAFAGPTTGACPAASGRDDYDEYVRREWALFAREPARAAAAREAAAGLTIARVLDIGCGAGQELRPFVQGGRTLGVGLDVSSQVGRAGRQLFTRDEPASRVTFVRAGAEHLPFAPSSFDVVTCRLALPYTDNARALAEMARVLRPGGSLILKIHHARYYTTELSQALRTWHLKSAIHACRVLLAGGETFQTLAAEPPPPPPRPGC